MLGRKGEYGNRARQSLYRVRKGKQKGTSLDVSTTLHILTAPNGADITKRKKKKENQLITKPNDKLFSL